MNFKISKPQFTQLLQEFCEYFDQDKGMNDKKIAFWYSRLERFSPTAIECAFDDLKISHPYRNLPTLEKVLAALNEGSKKNPERRIGRDCEFCGGGGLVSAWNPQKTKTMCFSCPCPAGDGHDPKIKKWDTELEVFPGWDPLYKANKSPKLQGKNLAKARNLVNTLTGSM